jgi:ribosomal protein S18 acetylase RimI-like enzyme
VIDIIYANEKYFSSFHEALSVVAKEKIYLEMIEAPPLEKASEFQSELISINGPVYYAIHNEKVVGWCDVFPKDNPRQNHRGSLGMGILPQFRGQGVGSLLLEKVIAQAKKFGLEKIELNVYTTNAAGIALYKKFGFEQEGLIRKYRKLDGQYFDSLAMGKFL